MVPTEKDPAGVVGFYMLGSVPEPYTIYMPWELNKLLQPEFVREGLKRLNLIEHIDQVMGAGLNKPFSKVAAMESSLYMRNQLLRDADWAGMAYSLEIRQRRALRSMATQFGYTYI